MAKLMFWILLLLLPMLASSWWGCPPHELTALNHIKQELLDPYDKLASWRGLYCCSWRGITCHRHTGHVVRVDLNWPQFYDLMPIVTNSSSQIFPALLQLQHLEHLDLSAIYFYLLPIPSQLSSLSRLMHLSLQGCGFTGSIPSEIGSMSSLQFLDISGNDFSGPIPCEIGNMSSLKFLDISYNYNLEMRQSSSWIRNLQRLEHLGMLDVNLTSDVVENVASLPNLTSLDMSYLSGTLLSPLVNLTPLSHLGLAGSYFTPQQFPIWILNLTSLVSLSLSDYNLTHSIPSTVLSLPHLRNLDLSGNPDLKVNLSFIVQHAFQLSILSIRSDSKFYWKYVLVNCLRSFW